MALAAWHSSALVFIRTLTAALLFGALAPAESMIPREVDFALQDCMAYFGHEFGRRWCSDLSPSQVLNSGLCMRAIEDHFHREEGLNMLQQEAKIEAGSVCKTASFELDKSKAISRCMVSGKTLLAQHRDMCKEQDVSEAQGTIECMRYLHSREGHEWCSDLDLRGRLNSIQCMKAVEDYFTDESGSAKADAAMVCKASKFDTPQAKVISRCMALGKALPAKQRRMCLEMGSPEAQGRIECMLYLNWDEGHEWCENLTHAGALKSAHCMRMIVGSLRGSLRGAEGLPMDSKEAWMEAASICKVANFDWSRADQIASCMVTARGLPAKHRKLCKEMDVSEAENRIQCMLFLDWPRGHEWCFKSLPSYTSAAFSVTCMKEVDEQFQLANYSLSTSKESKKEARNVCRVARFDVARGLAIARCMVNGKHLPLRHRNVCKEIDVTEATDRVDCMVYLDWPDGHEWCHWDLASADACASVHCMKTLEDYFYRPEDLNMQELQAKWEAKDVCRVSNFTISKAKAISGCMVTGKALPKERLRICKEVDVAEAEDRIECMLYLNWPAGHQFCSGLTSADAPKSVLCMKSAFNSIRRNDFLDRPENEVRFEAAEACKSVSFSSRRVTELTRHRRVMERRQTEPP